MDSQVLVSGGSSGIGLAIARAFHDAGAIVTITGRRHDAADYDTDLSGLVYRRCEMTEPESIREVVSSLTTLDVLVNNAGGNLRADDEWDPDVLARVFDLNVVGPFRMATACRPLLAASGAGGGASVVNVAAAMSRFGNVVVPAFFAAKAAIEQLTKSEALSWAADDIRVNAVAPGLTRTNMTADALRVPEVIDPVLARVALHRAAEPDEIAAVVLFLASPAARFVTGETVYVDGGASIT